MLFHCNDINAPCVHLKSIRLHVSEQKRKDSALELQYIETVRQNNHMDSTVQRNESLTFFIWDLFPNSVDLLYWLIYTISRWFTWVFAYVAIYNNILLHELCVVCVFNHGGGSDLAQPIDWMIDWLLLHIQIYNIKFFILSTLHSIPDRFQSCMRDLWIFYIIVIIL